MKGITMKCYDAGCHTPSGSDHHCATCHNTFSTLSLFDEHYSKGHAILNGLVRDDRGVWWTTEGLANRIRKAAGFVARNEERARSRAASPDSTPRSRKARAE